MRKLLNVEKVNDYFFMCLSGCADSFASDTWLAFSVVAWSTLFLAWSSCCRTPPDAAAEAASNSAALRARRSAAAQSASTNTAMLLIALGNEGGKVRMLPSAPAPAAATDGACSGSAHELAFCLFSLLELATVAYSFHTGANDDDDEADAAEEAAAAAEGAAVIEEKGAGMAVEEAGAADSESSQNT